MSSPFETRAQAALESNRFRLTDFATLIEEAATLAEQHRAAATHAERESVDFALSAEDRTEAAARAGNARRNAAAYAGAAEQLRARHAERMSSEKARARTAEREAATAERDALATEFGETVPKMAAQLVDLFVRVRANAERLQAAGCPGEANAEDTARAIDVGSVATPARFLEMKIPAWNAGDARTWPPEFSVDVDTPLRAARKAMKQSHAEAEAAFGQYRLTGYKGGQVLQFQYRFAGQVERERGLWREPWEGELRHTEAERLRGLGVKVEAIGDHVPELSPAVKGRLTLKAVHRV